MAHQEAKQHLQQNDQRLQSLHLAHLRQEKFQALQAEKQAQEREKEKEAAGNEAAIDDKSGNGGSSRQEEKPKPPQPSARELFLQQLKKGEFSTMESYILQDAASSGFTDSALLALCSYKGDPEAMMRYYSAVMKKMREGGDDGDDGPSSEKT